MSRGNGSGSPRSSNETEAFCCSANLAAQLLGRRREAQQLQPATSAAGGTAPGSRSRFSDRLALQPGRAAVERPLSGPAARHLGQAGGKQRDALADVVVKLSRDAAALLLLRVDQPPAHRGQCLFGAFVLGDVTKDLGDADHAALGVADRRHRHRHVKPLSRFRRADRSRTVRPASRLSAGRPSPDSRTAVRRER